jgi:protein with PEP-CTERM/exosortase system signal
LYLATIKMGKFCVLSVAFAALAATAQALPLTHFVSNATGGFDAFIFPELLDGTPAPLGGIFTLPQPVNAGYVIILKDGTNDPRNIANWTDVIHFIDNGRGKATTIQMMDDGPDQASYFPSLSTLRHSPVAVIVEAKNEDGFTLFTDYSVRSKQKRNYHFFTAEAVSVPDGGSTLAFLGIAFSALIVFRRSLLRA